MEYNFDEVVDRNGSHCVKWDAWKSQGKPEGLLPLWVADMDFKAPQPVIDALEQRALHGIYGYTMVDDGYFEAVAGWMERRHHWTIQKEWIVPTPGVVTALKIAVNAFTKPGEAVIIQKPVYYPFDFSIEQNGRKKIENEVVLKDGKFSIDYDSFEKQIIENDVKMYILCNPYNPIGKVWTKEELKKVGDICKKHNVIVVSDEIHHDFVFKNHTHIPFYEVDPSYQDFSIICSAPSKTFNLAGLQTSNIIIANETLRERFVNWKTNQGIGDPNIFGLIACKEAYTNCDDWCDQMLAYVQGNYDYMDQFLKTRLPMLKLMEPEGLYLAWVDFRALNLEEKQLETFMLEKAKLWLDEGYIFGKQGAGFERFNMATPRSLIKEALERLEKALNEEKMI